MKMAGSTPPILHNNILQSPELWIMLEDGNGCDRVRKIQAIIEWRLLNWIRKIKKLIKTIFNLVGVFHIIAIKRNNILTNYIN